MRERILDEQTADQLVCGHDKVYSDTVLCSYPPQYPWICRHCGLKGVDISGVLRPTETYDDVVKRFAKEASDREQGHQGAGGALQGDPSERS